MLNDLAILAPWEALPYKLNFDKELPHLSIIFGKCSIKNSQPLKTAIIKSFPDLALENISSNNNEAFIAIYCITEKQKDVIEALSQFGFSTVSLPQTENTAKQELEAINMTLSDIKADRKDLTNEALKYSRHLSRLQIIYDYFSIKKQEKKRI